MRKFSFTWVILAALFAAITSCGPTCELLSIDTRYFDTEAIEGKVKTLLVESKIFDVDTPSKFEFSLKNTYGSIRISGTPTSKISLRAEKTAWGDTDEDAQKILDKLEIIYNKRRNRLNVEVRIPRLSGPRSGKPPRADFVISLPETLKEVYVKSIYGNIKANNIHSSIEFRTTYGYINVDGSGNMEISAIYGGIDLKAKTSVLSASATYGSIDIDAEDSKISASSDHGLVRLQLASPNQVKAYAGYGGIDVELEKVQNVEVVAEGRKGQVHLSGFDKVEKEEISYLESVTAILGGGGKKLEFKSKYGRVDVRIR
jgi:DUF4097 and DUF4098 domain-containing protein YvlB